MQIRRADSAADFRAIHDMRAEMAVWDAAECARLGYPIEGVAEAYYSETVDELQAVFTAPRSAMLVVDRGEGIVAHAGFAPFAGDEAEVLLVWVTPRARGAGIAGDLLAALVAAMRAEGYGGAVLETAPFMTAAIRHYGRLGFAPCPPFREAPPGLAPITIFMRARF